MTGRLTLRRCALCRTRLWRLWGGPVAARIGWYHCTGCDGRPLTLRLENRP